MRLKPESRTSVSDLASLPLFVQGPEGRSIAVPLGQVAKVSTGLGPARIDHLDRERVIAIQANTEGRALDEVLADIKARFDQIVLPPGLPHQPRRREQGPGRESSARSSRRSGSPCC